MLDAFSLGPVMGQYCLALSLSSGPVAVYSPRHTSENQGPRPGHAPRRYPLPHRTARIDRFLPPAASPPMRAVAAAASTQFRALLLVFPHLPAPPPTPRPRFAMNPSSSSSSSGGYHSRAAAFASPQPRGGGGRRRGGGGGRGRGGGDGSDRIDALGRLL